MRSLTPAHAPVWDDATAAELDGWSAGLTESTSTEAVVVGLGASGLAALDELQRRGIDAIGVDAGAVAGGASGRNGGFLLGGLALFHHQAVAALGRDRAAAAYRRTLRELGQAVDRWPDLVRITGSVRVAASPEEEADCARHLEALVEDGFDADPYEGPEGTGLVIADDAVFQPLARCRRHAAELRAEGIRLHEHSRVTVAPHQVVAGTATIEAGEVLVCVDGELERLVPALTDRVRTTRLQMLATAPARDVALPRPVYRRWGYDYWHQLPDGRLAVGGGRDRHEPAEWGARPEPSAPVQAHLDGLLREVIGTTAAVTHRWAGTVAYTADRLPVVERIAPGLVVAGAYSGHGNLIGPLAARAAVELAFDGHSSTAALLAGPPRPSGTDVPDHP